MSIANLQKVTNGNACTTLSPCPQYNYDAENRMVSATSLQNTPDTTYVYDGDGRRVQKVQSTATTTYVYDATGNLAAEYGTPTDHGTKFLLTDHLGSTRVLVASDGTSPKRYDYLPFGEEIQAGTDGRGPEYSAGVYPSPAGLQSLEFTGKERDAETGLDYFGARYMTGVQGRFTSPDPKQMTARHLTSPQKWNKYAYVQNNPLAFVDPDGLDDWYVFRPLISNKAPVSKTWSKAIKTAEARGDTVHMLRGSDATVEAYRHAEATPGAHVVAVTHYDRQENGSPGSIELSNGMSFGSSGSESHGPQPNDPQHSTYDITATLSDTVAAKEVALFGCQSTEAAPAYSNTTFVGIDSPSGETTAVYGGLAAAAYLQAGGGQPGVDAAGKKLAASPSPVDKQAKVVLKPPEKAQQ